MVDATLKPTHPTQLILLSFEGIWRSERVLLYVLSSTTLPMDMSCGRAREQEIEY
jgi:hypothetical protein